MNTIKMSIIVPVYNVENYLGECLDSVINQTLKEIEIICINDGSTDNSLNILEEYQKNDNRIKIYSFTNAGLGPARNRGIKRAKGEYVAFLDSDDWFDLDFCERIYDYATKYDAEIVLFNSIEEYSSHQRERLYFPKNNNEFVEKVFSYKDSSNLVLEQFFTAWSKVHKTSFLLENNLEFPATIFEDVEFHVESFLKAKKIVYCPQIFHHYRKENPNSIMSNAGDESSFAVINVVNSVRNILINLSKMEEFRLTFFKFAIAQIKVRFETTNIIYQEKFLDLIKKEFLTYDMDNNELKKLPKDYYKFYIQVLNSNSLFEFNNYACSNTSNLSNNFDLNNKINLLYKISSDFMNTELYDAIKLIKKFNLFDYNFYKENYDYDGDLDPLLHYIYIGHSEGKNPSAIFDGNYYCKTNRNVELSELNPLVYFVLYGIKEGKVKTNENVYQHNTINKLELDKEFQDYYDLGVTELKRNPKLIVSLTSFPERMDNIHYCLYSLLTQSLKPDELVLWLSKEQFPNKEADIPKEVLKLKNNGLTIKWCNDLKSYKKLIPSLKEFPNDLIVTADDDIYYPKDWLEKLYNDYQKYPDCIISQRLRKISLNSDGEIDEYNNWKLATTEESPSFLNFSTNGAGSLFPPNVLHKDVCNESLFLELCSFGDDVWIWAMAILNHTKIKGVKENMPVLTCINPAIENGVLKGDTLWSINSCGGNDQYLNNIFNYYPNILRILDVELKYNKNNY